MTSHDAERQELERALELLGRSTRPGRLLEYLGSKYFSQQETQLTEFDIAREVFGRSLQDFDPGEDAVVRVEVHRLRKKLRDIYEKDTRAHGVQIGLPAGTYVPRFTVIPEAPHSPDSAPVVAENGAAGRRIPGWAWAVAAVLLVVVIAGVVIGRRPAQSPLRAEAAESAPTAPANATSGQVTELHIVAGSSGSEVIDNSGVRWMPDRYFNKGSAWPRAGGFVRGTSRQFLFSTWRTGEFEYDIPLAPGTYEMRLFFVAGQLPGDEKLSGFNIALNGKSLLEAYDIGMSANGPDVGDEQVFRDVQPGPDGVLRLGFNNHVSSPALNALEFVPGTPGKLQPIRILTQRTSFIDHQGRRWRADDYYQNGFLSTERSKVSGIEDPGLFGAERFGHFSYAIPVDRRGRYTVVLHFVEFFYGTQLSGGGGVGNRLFHVFCNGQTLLRNFDVYKEAGGSLRVVTKTFPHVQPSAYGKINLMFEPVINNATVSGIEILDESE
jgi:hypothetical protein